MAFPRGTHAHFARAWALGLALLLIGLSARAQPVAIEFFHAGFGHYFITTNPVEAANLDSGRTAGWARTGEQFPVAGSNIVCRFFSDRYAPKSSHFYTHYAPECNALRVGFVWQFEDLVFSVDVPDASGSCRAGTRPLYRLYNGSRGGAPNHRYTVRSDIAAAMRAQGWVPEGIGANAVFACVPGSAAPPPPAAPAAGLAGRWELASGVRMLSETEAALITSLDDSHAVLSRSLGLDAGQLFIVPDQGGYRVQSVADEGRALALMPATIEELFAELELEGTVALAAPGGTLGGAGGAQGAKAYLDPQFQFYKADLDGLPGFQTEFSVEADCSMGGAPKFEFVSVKFGVFGNADARLSRRALTYSVSKLRVVMDAQLKVGCKLSGDSGAKWLKRLPGRIPTNIPGVVLRVDFGPSAVYETDIAPVVQIASAKVDGHVDARATPAFAGTVNGAVVDKSSLLAAIAGQTGVTYSAKVAVFAEVRVWVNVAFVDVVGLAERAGPQVSMTAIYAAAARQLCGSVSFVTEAHLLFAGISKKTTIYKSETPVPTDWDAVCSTPPPAQPPTPPPPPTAGPPGPTGDWLFTRQSCQLVPAACGACPEPTLRVRLAEAPGGATIFWTAPDFPGDPGFTVTRQSGNVYQGCYEPVPGYVSCAAIGFDPPQKRTATMASVLAFDGCTVNADWLGAMR